MRHTSDKQASACEQCLRLLGPITVIATTAIKDVTVNLSRDYSEQELTWISLLFI